YFDYLKNTKGLELSSQQMKAASFDKGNALVLSTAGSGKTTVIIARAGRLLFENKCGKKILTLTFSKMAADDMKKRFSSIWLNDERKTEFSTIHAFSYKIVRDFYRRKGISFRLLTNNYQALSEILRNYYSGSYFSYVSDEEIENLSSAIGYVDNMMLAPVEYRDHGIKIKGFDKLYNDYKMYKSQNKLIDFDDMLTYSYQILSNSQSYVDKILNTYEYVQIDEMQDTSKIQHELIKLITRDNLFMVGDDDQAIYSFRGSYPEFMLKFKDIYDDGKIFYLDNNYRSDRYIVEGAKNFIEINKNRYKKPIKTDNKKVKEINIIKVKGRKEQAELITEILAKSKDENKTTGILFRYNMSAMIPANRLYENKIDFYIKEDKTKFFSSGVLYDVLAFLNLAVDHKDRDAYARIYYKSYTYFTKGMCRIVQESKEDKSVFDILYGYKHFDYKVYDKIKQFKRDIDYLNRLRPSDAIRFIKFDLEYLNYLERMQEEGRYSLSSSLHILEILEEIGAYCGDIGEFINKIKNLKDVIKKASENKGSNITLTSIHSAKGLEYDRVYIIDNLREMNFDKKNLDEDEYEKKLEEERRIFYVGMTRAKDELNIVVPGEPSQLIEELLMANRIRT
ncbi:MAG TPA: ATP-dependent helicase, partial [Sedimentibacter sp.]|nr:ATP-dependent helicase [Sedimentibacter sp.]